MFVQKFIKHSSRFASCDIAMGIAKPANPMREELLQTLSINLDTGRIVLQTKFVSKVHHLAGYDFLNVFLIRAGVSYTWLYYVIL